MPIAMCMPVPESPIAGHIRVGGLSGQPVTHIAPPMACAIGSKLLKPLYGPYVPKPFTVA